MNTIFLKIITVNIVGRKYHIRISLYIYSIDLNVQNIDYDKNGLAFYV